jgi:hypothetical protein
VTRARLAESAGSGAGRSYEIVKGLILRSFDDSVYSINDNRGQGFAFARYVREDGYLVPDLLSDDRDMTPTTTTTLSLAALAYTNVLLLALSPAAPQVGLNLRPTSLPARAAWYSFAFLIRAAAAELLDVDTNEFRVGMRTVRDTQGFPTAEIFISDNLENGAGYATFLARRDVMEDLLDRIGPSSRAERQGKTFYERLRNHTVAGKPCDSSCHDCLRDYSNMPYHGLLDWRLALDIADLSEGRRVDEARWLDSALDARSALKGAFGWKPATFGSVAFGVVQALIDERSGVANLLTHPLWDTDGSPSRAYAVAKLEAEAANYTVRPITLFDAIRRPGFLADRG